MEKLSCEEILELIAVSYEENRNHEFSKQLINFVNKKEYSEETITEEGIKRFLDHFTFPDRFEWCMREYSGYYSEKDTKC